MFDIIHSGAISSWAVPSLGGWGESITNLLCWLLQVYSDFLILLELFSEARVFLETCPLYSVDLSIQLFIVYPHSTSFVISVKSIVISVSFLISVMSPFSLTGHCHKDLPILLIFTKNQLLLFFYPLFHLFLKYF